ncbi:uncharacterized protein LOC126913014 [Spodoptera frugiperda]|uniref:Uncharacterized protein LOC126913014 n=1 Tax=Spodoptera frugiperda TaxID=7108 RepID=A0A9R0F682_SPOFR|nr:uncharacterized protein LOC126913014 [Spodoptera frugiperda]
MRNTNIPLSNLNIHAHINCTYADNACSCPTLAKADQALKFQKLEQFLANYWENDHLATIIGNKKILLTVEEHCYSYISDQNCVIKTAENSYECHHEEADTRIIFHAYKAAPGSRILIKSVDTDVLIILLGNIHKIPDSEIWLASSGTKKKKIRTSIAGNYTVAMYGIKHCTKVNQARYQVFLKNFSAKEDSEKFLKKVKSFDSNTIPPCWESLKQKILRTIFVNSMWLNATDSNCINLRPENYGWFSMVI